MQSESALMIIQSKKLQKVKHYSKKNPRSIFKIKNYNEIKIINIQQVAVTS